MKNKEHLNNGKTYWRSLNQLADTPEFKKFLHREFPEGASELSDGMNRRKFLTLMGASMALAGLTSCRRPIEKIMPYVKAPEEIIPGVPRYFATTMPMGLNSYGLVVETHEGRPTKIEGNPKHPSTMGATNVWLQAAILGLYDPDRSQFCLDGGNEKKWNAFVKYWQDLYTTYTKNNGEGLAVLSESFASPTMYRLKAEFLKTFPKARWFTYEPVSEENIRAGIRAATGENDLVPVYAYDRAKVIVALDADFVSRESENVMHARGFAGGRQVRSTGDKMNRLYVAESSFTLTGGMADHRRQIPSGHMYALTLALAKELTRQGVAVDGANSVDTPADIKFDKKWLTVMAGDLIKNRGYGLVVAGRQQPAQVHALVLAINSALDNVNKTVSYRKAKYEITDSTSDLTTLAASVNDKQINALVVLGGNPVYDSPVNIDFSTMLARLEHSVHFGLYADETAEACKWHVPRAHFLESWGDAQAVDGTLSIVQPMIAPLFKGQSDIEMLGFLTRAKETTGYELVRDTWQTLLGAGNFDKKWRRVLHDGVLEASKLSIENIRLRSAMLNEFLKDNPIQSRVVNRDNLEIVFQVSPAVYDGRFANNGWLQELPDGATKLAWDNAVLVSQRTAAELGVKSEDLVVLDLDGREMAMPVWIQPGQADYSLAVVLGYGRKSAGRIGNGVGFNAYHLRRIDSLNMAYGVTVRRTPDTYALANTQDHSSMEGRPLVRESDIQGYHEHPEFAGDMVEHPPLLSLWDEHSYEEGNQWGMTIDLNSCTGCNACTIACQSENNIPIVGKEQVREGREMHWLRLDRYFAGEEEDPEMVFQPVGCQHCENAPCEQVCPVAATSHDKEGLNVMTYNRCIGTRYCSNNCPFKVRRFNFFNYTKELPEIVHMAQNPDVTVRSRGVMEKCTYCVQRISEARINAKKGGRELQDGDVVSACQQACPTNAIVFGNINDPESKVHHLKKNDRNYEMLAELNIKPRTSYLAKLRNPHPELAKS